MKKEASVILAKCAQDKLYGIRIEKRDNDWVRTWAFKLKEETAEKENKSHLYMDMIVLIEQIADYIIPKNNTIRKGLGDVMGGKILKLQSEELLELGEARGKAKGRLEGKREERLDAIQNMMDLGLTKEQILRKYSLEEYEAALRSMPAKI